MKLLVNHTLKQYAQALASKQSTPGGGSAAALVGALGVGLLVMASEYSISFAKTQKSKRTFQSVVKKLQNHHLKLMLLVDEDAKAYAAVVKAKQKDKKAYKKALRQAIRIPQDVINHCQKAIEFAPLLVKEGNPYLVSDVKAGCEMLLAAYNSAKTMIEANQ